MDVLVFITSIESLEKVSEVKPLLTSVRAIKDWNFDLDDCDKVLRIEAAGLNPGSVERLLHNAGFNCQELE